MHLDRSIPSFEIYPLAKQRKKGSDKGIEKKKKEVLLLARRGTSKYKNDFEGFFHERMKYRILADEAQYEYVSAIIAPTSEVQAVFSDSAAGTGKTAVALASAYYLLEKGDVECITYVRNTVAVRETGFLPGTVEDKELAYMKPVQDAINNLGANDGKQDLFEKLLEAEKIICTSTSFMRGIDYSKDMILIIDEAQNLDLVELQTVLTRAHDNVKIVVIGSSLQNDNAKIRKYGPKKLLPFQLYMDHFSSQTSIPVKNVTLTTNYRGRFANFADQIQRTVERVNHEQKEVEPKEAVSNVSAHGYSKESFQEVEYYYLKDGINKLNLNTGDVIPINEPILDSAIDKPVESIPFYGLGSFQ